MSCSVVVTTVLAYKVSLENKTKQVKRFREEDGSPFFKDVPDGKCLSINGQVIAEGDKIYEGDKIDGLKLFNPCETNEWFLGVKIDETDDLMYGSTSLELPNDVESEAMSQFVVKHKLTQMPKGYALCSTFC